MRNIIALVAALLFSGIIGGHAQAKVDVTTSVAGMCFSSQNEEQIRFRAGGTGHYDGLRSKNEGDHYNLTWSQEGANVTFWRTDGDGTRFSFRQTTVHGVVSLKKEPSEQGIFRSGRC